MGELGRITAQADAENDVVKAACLVDKQQRGQEVMELATNEVLVVQDAGSTPQQRQFAKEKLAALADRMGQLVDQARGCSGDTAPEDQDDRTRTEVDQRQGTPYADATVIGTGRPAVPPAVDDARPPTVESPSS